MSLGETETTSMTGERSGTVDTELEENEGGLMENEEEPVVNPIDDIIDYLVRCARGAFACARVGEREPTTARNTALAREIYRRSISDFLTRFGKQLVYSHLEFFENAATGEERDRVRQQIEELRRYHSPEGKLKRLKNRRYRALQKLREDSDYFTEKEMMYRNPLLYEQLIGQFLTDEEIAQRDDVDSDRLTFVNMILETVDRNKMRQTRNEQELSEKLETAEISDVSDKPPQSNQKKNNISSKPIRAPLWGEFESTSNGGGEPSYCSEANRWGDFEKPDTTPSFEPDVRQQNLISAPERDLLRREFLHEMYSSFLEGRDVDFDYGMVDENEQYDDLQTVDRDKEEEYFDSEPVENESLEQTMKLTHEYGRKSSSSGTAEDELDVFMEQLNKRQEFANYNIVFLK